MDIAALVISGVSLIIAVISYITSIRSQHLQDKVNALELKLKEIELAEKEKEQQKLPHVEARIIHITKEKYKIKIWNSGNATAKNVVAYWSEPHGVLLFDEEKMPFEFLDPQKSFELSISTYNGSPRKLFITTEWEDDSGKKHSKEQWCDL